MPFVCRRADGPFVTYFLYTSFKKRRQYSQSCRSLQSYITYKSERTSLFNLENYCWIIVIFVWGNDSGPSRLNGRCHSNCINAWNNVKFDYTECCDGTNKVLMEVSASLWWSQSVIMDSVVVTDKCPLKRLRNRSAVVWNPLIDHLSNNRRWRVWVHCFYLISFLCYFITGPLNCQFKNVYPLYYNLLLKYCKSQKYVSVTSISGFVSQSESIIEFLFK